MHHKILKSRRHKKLKSVDPANKFKHVGKKNLKYDAKPADINIQEVPKKARQLMLLTQKMKSEMPQESQKKKRKKSKLITVFSEKRKEEYGMSKPLKSGPESVAQRPYETDDQFVQRVGRMANVALQEVKMELKYGIEVGYEKKKSTDENDPRIIALMKDMNKKTEKVSKKKLKRKKVEEKKIEKKRKTGEVPYDFEHLNDQVQFNEVVSEPPTFKQKNIATRKPGKSDLILKSLMPSKGVDLKGKRKNLAIGERMKIEKLRTEAVETYRQMKKWKKH